MVMDTLLDFDSHWHTIHIKFPLVSNMYHLFLATFILTRTETTSLDPGSMHRVRVEKCGCDCQAPSTVFNPVMILLMLAIVFFGLSFELSFYALDCVYQIFAFS